MLTSMMRWMSKSSTGMRLLLLYAVLLGVATFVEKEHGARTARELIYLSPLLFVLYALMAINVLCVTLSRRQWSQRHLPYLTIHAALLTILLGALITHLYAREGTMRIQEGERTNRLLQKAGEEYLTAELPFDLELLDFRLERYPGTQSPSSYESDLVIHRKNGEKDTFLVRMNRVLDEQGYRFYQSNYDPDEKGTILSVSNDPFGSTITYTGYALLVLGFILMLLMPTSHFRRTQRRIARIRQAINELERKDRPVGKNAATAAILLILSALMPMTSQAATAKGDTARRSTALPLLKVHEAPLKRANEGSDKEKEQAPPAEQDTHGPMIRLVEGSIPSEHREAFRQLAIQWKGRTCPVSTLAHEVTRKITKSNRVNGLSPETFLLRLLSRPDAWLAAPFIESPSKEVSKRYDLGYPKFAYTNVFMPSGYYRLAKEVESAIRTEPEKRTQIQKDLLRIHERLNIVHQIVSLEPLKLFPRRDDPEGVWLSSNAPLNGLPFADSLFVRSWWTRYLSAVDAALSSDDWTEPDRLLLQLQEYQQATLAGNLDTKRLKAEDFYNRTRFITYLRIAYLLFGGMLLMVTLFGMFQTAEYRRTNRPLQNGFLLVGLAAVVVHLVALALRGYIAGYVPWSNSYETMLYVSLCAAVAGMILGRGNRLVCAVGMLLAGVILFVAGLQWMDPQVGTLVPVLQSIWLMLHVAVIVTAYGFFALSCILGLICLLISLKHPLNRTERQLQILRLKILELTELNRLSLYLGVAFMAVGTFLGAVWANEAWGRYWGWDPKETWALITLILYAIIVHIHLLKFKYEPWLLNLLSVLAITSVLMTYFGVNYLLTGLHSYGYSGGMGQAATWVFISMVVVLILALIVKPRWKEIIEAPIELQKSRDSKKP